MGKSQQEKVALFHSSNQNNESSHDSSECKLFNIINFKKLLD